MMVTKVKAKRSVQTMKMRALALVLKTMGMVMKVYVRMAQNDRDEDKY